VKEKHPAVLVAGCAKIIKGFRVSGFQGFRVSGFQGFRVSGFQGFRVSGFKKHHNLETLPSVLKF